MILLFWFFTTPMKLHKWPTSNSKRLINCRNFLIVTCSLHVYISRLHIHVVGSTEEHCFTTEGIFDPLAGKVLVCLYLVFDCKKAYLIHIFNLFDQCAVCIFDLQIVIFEIFDNFKYLTYLTYLKYLKYLKYSCGGKRPIQLCHLAVQVLQVSLINHTIYSLKKIKPSNVSVLPLLLLSPSPPPSTSSPGI